MLAGWYRSGREDVRAMLIPSLHRRAAERMSRPQQSAFALALEATLFADAARALDRPEWAQQAIELCDASVPLHVDRPLNTHQWAWTIRAWAITGAAFARPALIDAATDQARRFEDTGRSLQGEQGQDGRFTAHDHAALSWAWLALYEATGNPHWLERAEHWSDRLLARFWTERPGECFDDVSDAAHRAEDGGPGLYALATLAFSRLAHFLGRDDLAARARAVAAQRQALLERQPLAHGWMALAADWQSEHIAELALFGTDDDPVLSEMRTVAVRSYHPFLLLAHVPTQYEAKARSRIPWLTGRGARNGTARAYLCEGGSCRIPARTATALDCQLASLGPSPSS